MTTLEACCKNCLSVNTDGDALIFTGVLIDGHRYDVRIECRDAQGNVIKVPESTQYLKETIEKVVDLSAKIFGQIDSSARARVHLTCEEGKNPIYKETDKSPVELKTDETKKTIQDPLKEILKLFREEQYAANVDPSRIIQVKWQAPSSWQPSSSSKPASNWPACPPLPPAPLENNPPPPPPKDWDQKTLDEEAAKILDNSIEREGPCSGSIWNAPAEAGDPINQSLSRLYTNPKSPRDNDQAVRKWFSKYYHSVYNIFKEHGAKAHKDAQSQLEFDAWCREQTVKKMFGEGVSVDQISKIIIP